MKSKHKHELQTNELAQALGRLVEWAKPHGRMIGYGAVAVLVLIIVLIVLPAIRGSAAGRNPAAEAFADALSSGQIQPVRDFLADYSKSEQITVARLILADRLLAEVVRGVQVGAGEDAKAKAAKILAEAKDLYTQIAQSAPDRESMARTGLALVTIQEGDLDKGRAALAEIVSKWPGSLGAQKAKANLEALANYKPIEFSDEPLEEPKPPEAKPAEATAPAAAPAPAETPKPAPAAKDKPAVEPKG
jgi:hypothetical protein